MKWLWPYALIQDIQENMLKSGRSFGISGSIQFSSIHFYFYRKYLQSPGPPYSKHNGDRGKEKLSVDQKEALIRTAALKGGRQSGTLQIKSYTYQDEHASIHVVNVHNTYKHNMVYT